MFCNNMAAAVLLMVLAMVTSLLKSNTFYGNNRMKEGGVLNL